MPTPEKHALLSASSAERWLNCTPSARLAEDMPDKSTQYTEAGRLAHAIAELKLRKQYLEAMGPRKFTTALNKLKADPHFEPEMLSATDEYMDFINETFLAFPARPYITAEQQVDFSEYVPEGFGTADCIVIGGGVLHIVDYKNGAGKPVEAERNPQMMLYALGAASRYCLMYDIQTVRMTIVQPHAGGVKTWETSYAELLDWGANTVRPQAEKAYRGEGEQVPGSWCQFCKLKGSCRARGQHLALEAFGQKTAPTYSDEEIGGILRRAQGLAAWVKDLEEYALSQVLAGRAIPGWKAVAGRSVRKFDDMEKAFADIKAAGYEEALLYERRPLTLAAIEKVLGKKAFQDAAGAHVVTPPGAPTLVPDTDRRPALNAAEEAFKNQQ